MSPARSVLAAALVTIVGMLGYWVLAAGSETIVPQDPRERLAISPLDGEAFGEIALASEADSDPAAAMELHEIATRRDPRNLRVRAWLADVHLRAGDYPAALEQLDVVLRLSPEARKAVLPMMVQWAADPAFASALVERLRTKPNWRGSMEQALRKAIDSPGAGAVFAGLSASGDISPGESGRWLGALMNAGHWGLAYSYWASGLHLAVGEALPMLYNGGFEQAPTQAGFDWRTERRSGTYTEFVAVDGANGNAAHLVFHGRPAAFADLEEALALPPGRYRIDMRVKAIGLRSDQGLQWVLTCHGRNAPIATGEGFNGTFGWRESMMEFDVPEAGCPGQWLRLANPAPRGSAQMVSGELWFDDLVLRPVQDAAGSGSH